MHGQSFKIHVEVDENEIYRLIDEMDNESRLKIFEYIESKIDGEKFKGIDKIGNRWRARITHKKKTYNLGYFKNKSDANEAYNKKRNELE